MEIRVSTDSVGINMTEWNTDELHMTTWGKEFALIRARNERLREALRLIEEEGRTHPRGHAGSPSKCASIARAALATQTGSLFASRYHVPKNQCYGGSRGGQSGNVHLHVLEQFDLGRIHRRPGQALCGRSGWYERPADVGEEKYACPRCHEIAGRLS